MDQTVGDDFYRKSGRWMKLYRLIDRVKKWYDERVTDPATRNIVHECSEPPTNHRNHSSAKSKSERPRFDYSRRYNSTRAKTRLSAMLRYGDLRAPWPGFYPSRRS